MERKDKELIFENLQKVEKENSKLRELNTNRNSGDEKKLIEHLIKQSAQTQEAKKTEIAKVDDPDDVMEQIKKHFS